MYASPLMPEYQTRLPAGLRLWAGRRLSGPPRGQIQTSCPAAIFQVARIGDFVLSLSAIRLLLDAWGEENCRLIVADSTVGLAALEFPRTPRIVLPSAAPALVGHIVPAWWRHRRKFRGFSAERVVCLTHQRDLYTEIALTWLRASRRHALVRATYPTESEPDRCLELTAHRKIVSEALGRAVTDGEILPRFTSVTPGNDGSLLVCPFASEAVRCLPGSMMVAALQAWRKKSAAPLRLCASPAEGIRLEALAAEARAAGIERIETVLPRDVATFVRTVAAAGAVFGMDSSAAHIATAFDKPGCFLNGGGSDGLCLPWRRSSRQVYLKHRVPCWHCGWRCSQPEPYCITRVAPDEIAASLPAL